RRAVLLDRALRQVDVDVAVGDLLGIDAEPGGIGAGPRVRGLGALLHDVAHLAGQPDLALAGVDPALDEHDVAADRRPGEPGDDADLGLAAGGVADVARRAEQVLELAAVERDVGGALGDLHGGAAAHRRDLALEVAHAGLARVAVDDVGEDVVVDLELAL